MPRDGFALAVLIGGEEEFVGLGQQLLELPDLGLLVGVDDIDGLEVVFDVHPEAAYLAGVLVRDLGRAVREVADVPDARLDDVSGAEIALDRLRLGRRLDDDESAAALCGLAGRGQLRSSLRSTLGGHPGSVMTLPAVLSLRSVTVQPAPVSNGKSPQRPLER